MGQKYSIGLSILFITVLFFLGNSGFSMLTIHAQAQNELYLPIVLFFDFNQWEPTNTPTATSTSTPRPPGIPSPSPTPSATITETPTPTFTVTHTSTTTLIPFVSITVQFPSLTPTRTQTPALETLTPTTTPTRDQPPEISPRSWLIILLIGLLWVVLLVWVILFLRQRRNSN